MPFHFVFLLFGFFYQIAVSGRFSRAGNRPVVNKAFILTALFLLLAGLLIVYPSNLFWTTSPAA